MVYLKVYSEWTHRGISESMEILIVLTSTVINLSVLLHMRRQCDRTAFVCHKIRLTPTDGYSTVYHFPRPPPSPLTLSTPLTSSIAQL